MRQGPHLETLAYLSARGAPARCEVDEHWCRACGSHDLIKLCVRSWSVGFAVRNRTLRNSASDKAQDDSEDDHADEQVSEPVHA